MSLVSSFLGHGVCDHNSLMEQTDRRTDGRYTVATLSELW